jgi:hypothetical protein
MFFHLLLNTSNPESIKKFISILNKINQTPGINIKIISNQYYYNNRKSKRITILKSPHVNKKAQEHYSMFKFKQVIKLESLKVTKLIVLLKKLRTYNLPEAEFKIKIILNRIRLNKNKVDPDIYFLDFSPNLLNKKLKTYLKIVANFGEIVFQRYFYKIKIV